MTDKEYREQKKRLKKLIDKWHKTLGMGWFHIDMIYDRARNDSNPETTAITSTSWQYRKATITWYMPSVADNDDDFLEGIVVHEFVHVLVAPMMLVDKQEDLPLQHEYATESVARAIRWAREAGRKDNA